MFVALCTDEKIMRSLYKAQVSIITFSWPSHGLLLIERNLEKWILSTKSSCVRR